MGDPLFREESQQARANRWLGRVVLIRPVSFSFLTAAALAFTMLLAVFFTFVEYTRKALVTGVLAPSQGLARVMAQQSGMVEAVHVREGDAVARDAVMIVLTDGREGRGLQEIGAALLARLAEREAALARQRELALAAKRAEQEEFAGRRAAIAHELAQVYTEIATQSRRKALADGSLERAARLNDIGFLSRAQLEREHDAALEQQSRLEQLKRARIALSREATSVAFEAESARSRADAQVAALDVQRASIGEDRIGRDLQFHAAIVAPVAGTISTMLVEPGQTVIPGAVLATLIPAGSALEAHLYAPSRSIGFVHEGEEVLLRYLAYPHQKFGMHPARIVAVSRNPMLPGELGFAPADGSREPVYRIKAALGAQAIRAYGRFEPLQPGMQVEADVLLDRRRLVEWIFEPLLGLAGRT